PTLNPEFIIGHYADNHFILLGKQAFLLLTDYTDQKKAGIDSPVYRNGSVPALKDKGECW
ncbi:MAG: hypothetical protein LIP04_03810, partial [Tannerellaceae bacterium]|nr:hypothetical protein [Tannerellaceae bacterium]